MYVLLYVDECSSKPFNTLNKLNVQHATSRKTDTCKWQVVISRLSTYYHRDAANITLTSISPKEYHHIQ